MSKSYDPVYDPDFVGYNCRDLESDGDYGIIETTDEYAEEYFPQIINEFPHSLKKKFKSSKLSESQDRSEKLFVKWKKDISIFFKENGIRWIFVRENLPDSDLDSNVFYVSIPEEKLVCCLESPFDNDEVKILVYCTKGENKIKPKMIPVIEEDEDCVEDIDEDLDFESEEDEDLTEEDSTYWENVWEKGDN